MILCQWFLRVAEHPDFVEDFTGKVAFPKGERTVQFLLTRILKPLLNPNKHFSLNIWLGLGMLGGRLLG